MKSKALKILALCLAFTFVFCGVLGASAAKYVANVIADRSDYASFVQPGDMDVNNMVDDADAGILKEILLADTSDGYSDVNGDGETNICDLVLQDSQPDLFVDGAKINLNGKSIYKEDIGSILTTGAKYKITFAKTGDVKVVIKGLGSEISTVATDYAFTTPLTISTTDVELYVVGNGTIENLKLARVDMDNDVAVN